jgi:short-subunit dehydrogenase
MDHLRSCTSGRVILIRKVGREMHARSQGRILIAGSVAGFMPGTFQAVYSGTKAFLNSFSFACGMNCKTLK